MQLCRTLSEILIKLANLSIYKEIKDPSAFNYCGAIIIACRELTMSDNLSMTGKSDGL